MSDSLVSMRSRISTRRYCRAGDEWQRPDGPMKDFGYIRRTALLLNFDKNDILLYYCVARIQKHGRFKRRGERRCPESLRMRECGDVEEISGVARPVV